MKLAIDEADLKIDRKILIISLIFVAILYSLLIISYDEHIATSFLFGALASLFDIYALARLVKMVMTSSAGWLFVPLGVFRWALVGFIIFISIYYYKAQIVALLIGVAIPFVCVILGSIYKLYWGKGNGTSS